jgi:hypothetical protein
MFSGIFGIVSIAFVTLCGLFGLLLLLLFVWLCIAQTVGISSACRHEVINIVYSYSACFAWGVVQHLFAFGVVVGFLMLLFVTGIVGAILFFVLWRCGRLRSGPSWHTCCFCHGRDDSFRQRHHVVFLLCCVFFVWLSRSIWLLG